MFAKTTLDPGTVSAIFNGHRLPFGLNPAVDLEECGDDTKIYQRLSYNIHMPEDADFFLDVPPDQADLAVYRASLGHKVAKKTKTNW